jgi:membrane protein required for colicin V production
MAWSAATLERAMTPTDWVLLAVVAVSTAFGAMRGFIGVLASLAAWILAGWAAWRFGGQVGVWFAGGDEPGPTALFGGYALSFLLVLVAVGLVGWGVRRLMRTIGLSGIDRFLGLVLGLARGAFVACALVLLMGFTGLPREPEWERSRTLPLFLPGAQAMRGWLPDWAAVQVDLGRRDRAIDAGELPAPPPARRLPLPVGASAPPATGA